jgi:hypothetical protein
LDFIDTYFQPIQPGFFQQAYSILILQMRRDVRIVLVGDGKFILRQSQIYGSLLTRRVRDAPDGVGKSTIVTSLIKESFIPNVRLPTIPG